MSLQIRTVTTKRDYKTFVRFANRLYKGNRYYVPSICLDDLNTFDKEKNGAFEFCDAELYLAYKDGKPVGRVAAIVNYKANDAWKVNQVRFGWIDFIDDLEVSAALLDAVVRFGKERGMTQIVGPFIRWDSNMQRPTQIWRRIIVYRLCGIPWKRNSIRKDGYLERISNETV